MFKKHTLFSYTGALLLALVVGGGMLFAFSDAQAKQCPIPVNGNVDAVTDSECTIANPLGATNDIRSLICLFTTLLVKDLMPPIMVLMVLWASFLLLTSVGQPAKLVEARSMVLYAIIGAVILIMAAPLVSLVGSAVGSGATAPSCNPANATPNALTVLANIINWFSWLLAVLSVAMGLYAAFLYMTAHGEPQKVATANNVLVYTVIGVVVAILAFSVIAIIKTFTGIEGGGGSSTTTPPPTSTSCPQIPICPSTISIIMTWYSSPTDSIGTLYCCSMHANDPGFNLPTVCSPASSYCSSLCPIYDAGTKLCN